MGVGHVVAASCSNAWTEPPGDERVRQSVVDAPLGQRGGARRGRHGGRPGVGACVVPPARRSAPGVRVVLVRRRPHGTRPTWRAGFRHLLVLLGIGMRPACGRESDPVLAVKPSGVDAVYKWGMDCPDCIYTGSRPAGRRDLPPVGQSWLGPLRRAAVDGRHGLHRPTSCSTSSTSGPTGRSSSSSRPSPTRATGCRSPRTPPCWWSGTSSTTGTHEVASVDLSIERIGPADGSGGAPGGGPEGGHGPPADRPG